MSTSYSAGQYDSEFAPKRLQMHQLPKSNLSQMPAARKNDILFIADRSGHLLPNVPRSNTNPFGDYVGTWDMPKTIPGPYHLVKTGRSEKNIDLLKQKKSETDKSIQEARENQKPLKLRAEEN